MSKKRSERLSEAEPLEKIARYGNSNRLGFCGVIIGVLGILLGAILGLGVLALTSCAFFAVGFVCLFFLKDRPRRKAESLVTPQLRELIQKMESIGGNYTVTALIFRNGEVILAIRGYSFEYGLPSGEGSLQNIDRIRSRFMDSLTPVCKLIDILRDSCGKIEPFSRGALRKKKGRICYEFDHRFFGGSFGHRLLVHQNGQ